MTALILLTAALSGALAQQASEDPLELGIEERVDINFVLVDFIVLDAEGRTVPDLALDELKLKVGGRKTPVAVLDRSCWAGAAEDPRRPRRTTAAPVPPSLAPGAEPPRIVLVFDYDHMTETAEVFDRVQAMLNSRPTGLEEHMLVSFSEVVRIETPFTRDLDELRWALHRMRNDRDLYARHRSRMTELQFFDRVRALFDLMERWPGRKNVVLFSGPFARDGFNYDNEYRDHAALSTATRTAIYPVDTIGLRTASGPSLATPDRPPVIDLGAPSPPSLGGLPELRRLAIETGGQMTSETNDIGMAYAQAQRDLGCVYTLGFYDPKLKEDRNRRLSIKLVGRPGHRVVFPDYYVVRSDEQKRESLFKTATLAPHMFESEQVRTEMFVTGAASGNWTSVIGAEIRLAPGAVTGLNESWALRGSLRKPNGTLVHTFARDVTMPEPREGEPIVASTYEELVVSPGDYALSVVLSDPRGEPRASTRPVTLPAVPKRGPFLIGPILGHRTEQVFEPLMDPWTTPGAGLDALTVLCIAGGTDAGTRPTLTRWLADLDGADVERFEDASFELKGDGLRCREVVDSLKTSGLAPGRYEINATASMFDWTTDESTVEFTIRDPGHAETE